MQDNQALLFSVIDGCLAAFRPSVIFDVGARDGKESIEFAQKFPAARVFAFECHPDLLPRCKAALSQYPRIELAPFAVSKHSGTIPFYPIDHARSRVKSPDGNPGASSILRASGKYPSESYVQSETAVPSVRLDDFCDRRQLSHPDLIWMDIQGAELEALQSLGARLDRASLMHIEVEFMEIYSGQPLFRDIRAFLRGKGWTFAGFTSYSRYFADAIFVNARLVDEAAIACARERLHTSRAMRKYWRHEVKRRLRSWIGAG